MGRRAAASGDRRALLRASMVVMASGLLATGCFGLGGQEATPTPSATSTPTPR
jgi:hypothetical protein